MGGGDGGAPHILGDGAEADSREAGDEAALDETEKPANEAEDDEDAFWRLLERK